MCVSQRCKCSHLLKFLQTESKESKWDMPDELLLLLEKVEKEAQPSNALV